MDAHNPLLDEEKAVDSGVKFSERSREAQEFMHVDTSDGFRFQYQRIVYSTQTSQFLNSFKYQAAGSDPTKFSFNPGLVLNNHSFNASIDDQSQVNGTYMYQRKFYGLINSVQARVAAQFTNEHSDITLEGEAGNNTIGTLGGKISLSQLSLSYFTPSIPNRFIKSDKQHSFQVGGEVTYAPQPGMPPIGALELALRYVRDYSPERHISVISLLKSTNGFSNIHATHTYSKETQEEGTVGAVAEISALQKPGQDSWISISKFGYVQMHPYGGLVKANISSSWKVESTVMMPVNGAIQGEGNVSLDIPSKSSKVGLGFTLIM